MGKIKVLSLNDEQVAKYMRCPFKFYHGSMQGKMFEQPSWQMQVQYVVNQIVRGFYHLPQDRRTSLQVLLMIEKYWKKISPLAELSRSEQYVVLVKLTDHLLQSLQDTYEEPPVFLMEKMSQHIEELDIKLSMTFQVGKWVGESYELLKYAVDDREDVILSYFRLGLVLCHRAFESLPLKMKVVSLVDGKVYECFPNEEDVAPFYCRGSDTSPCA